MTEMIVTFALLALFMVAATRMISYTVDVYYQARGTSYGLQVTNMIAQKVVGQIEGAQMLPPTVTRSSVNTPEGSDLSNVAEGSDCIKFCDATGSTVSIYAQKQGSDAYVVVHYDEVNREKIINEELKTEKIYKAVDWKFDPKAYMGYTVKGLTFENPGDDYPDNVIRMMLTLYSPKYGEYQSTYYIKCAGVDEIKWV